MKFQDMELSPIEAQVIVVDEGHTRCSLTYFMTHSYSKQIPDAQHCMLVGDVDQLPSVG